MNFSKILTRSTLVCGALFGGLNHLHSADFVVESRKASPNVIIVLTDDQGYGDVGLHGHPFLETPAMDRIAETGVRFEQFHVASMCSPTRAALLTGLNPLRNGVVSTAQGLHTIRHGIVTMPELFADAGYATGLFGKWHLGRNYPNRPEDKGFEETFTLYGHSPAGISSRWENDFVDTWFVQNGTEVQSEGYCTDAIFDAAMGWISEQASEPHPFFAYIATNAPHFPFWAPEDLTEKYAGTDNPEFFAMMENLDDNLGRLEAFLDDSGLVDNTIVIFVSDNGPVGGYSTFNAGMAGRKATPWEGGHRVPFFIRYPEGGLSGGKVVEDLADVTDVLPTLASLTGVPLPDDLGLDGLDLTDAMREGAPIPERVLTMHIQQQELDPKLAAVMMGDWRLLWADSLFNVRQDPAQTNDVAEDYPEIFTRMWLGYRSLYDAQVDFATTAQPELIGTEAQPVSILDASLWYGPKRADGQKSVRLARGKTFGPEGGPWKVKAVRDGIYRVSLYRWPREADLPLTSGAPLFQTRLSGEPLPEGVALPVHHASLDVDTRRFIAEPSGAGATAVHFEIPMSAGEHRLHGIFRDAEGNALCGAFYAEIEWVRDLE